MANTRDLKRKIVSLQNMQKVMRAMHMIASAKFSKISYLQNSLKVFNDALYQTEKDILLAFKGQGYPELDGYEKIKNIEIVVFTADRGLCGSHNSSVQKALLLLAENKSAEKTEIEITAIGKKGASISRRNNFKIYHESEINEKILTDAQLYRISDNLLERFYSGNTEEIYFIYNEFISTLVQTTRVVRALPFEEPSYVLTNVSNINSEPEGPAFVRNAAKAVFNYRLKTALLNSYLSEHASRMTAMDNATTNADDLIHHYEKIKNKARQSAITNEIIEIVAGKEAM